MAKKVLYLTTDYTDFLPWTNADFLPRITGGGRQKLFLTPVYGVRGQAGIAGLG